MSSIGVSEPFWDLVDDISWLHKENMSEVFLYGCSKYSENNFHAISYIDGSCHRYYFDQDYQHTDLVFLLECGRQAETFIVHKYYAQDKNINFVLDDWHCQFSEGYIPKDLLDSQEIFLDIKVSNQKWLGKRLLSQDYSILFTIDNFEVAQLKMSVKYMTRDAYIYSRRRARGGDILYSNQLKSEHVPLKLTKKNLGRKNSSNILLEDVLNVDGDFFESILTVDFSNISYFDHKQDHYPAMVLVEAGKQISNVICHIFSSSYKWVLAELKNEFKSYSEFDSKLKILAKPICLEKENIIVEVRFIQFDTVIACGEYKFINLGG